MKRILEGVLAVVNSHSFKDLGEEYSVGMEAAVLDRIIERLIEVRSSKPGKLVQLSESEIKQLCVASREIFVKQPNLLELQAPIKICGMRCYFLPLPFDYLVLPAVYFILGMLLRIARSFILLFAYICIYIFIYWALLL